MEYKYEKISLIDFIKTLTIYKGLSLRKLLEKLSDSKGYSKSYSGFYNRLKNESIKFSDIKMIADELGYEIIFRE